MPETRAMDVTAALADYYTKYYRDTLGIPAWRDLVNVRLDDNAYEGQRLAALERAVGPIRGKRLLNVGCGTGGFNVLAEAAGAEVWGVDENPDAVAITRARMRGGERAVHGVAESLPFPDASFDVVYCYAAIEHVEDARRSLHEMVRVMRPDARLYLHTNNRWSCFEGHYKVFWLPWLPAALARLYLAARGRPTAYLATLRPLSRRECLGLLEAAGGCLVRDFDLGHGRPVGGPLWPLVRLYYRAFRITPYIEFVAGRGQA
ncbi:MAG TPA: class I SAM-dependent methyltransferase [Methylomirabilota bacterium]|nr:class I SAM-dependent methyltransferase [Methylomirabilota bacterium]